eukprot:m.90259 g.90259  ORF g.90259 m.90259 type:complete len:223 (+) comp51093_c0_seq8:131-799(+)
MWRTTSAGMGSTSWLRHAPTRSDMFCADFCWRRVGLDATSGRVCVALTFFIAALLCFGLSEDYSGAFTAGVVLTFVAHVIVAYAISVPRAKLDPPVALHWPRLIPFVLYGAIFGYFIISGAMMTKEEIAPSVIYVFFVCLASWRCWARVGHKNEDTRRQLAAAVAYLAFIINNSLVAWNQYCAKLSAATPVSLGFYYLGMTLLAVSQPLHSDSLVYAPLINA